MTKIYKRIVCLAISKMPGGRCVAGIEIKDGRRGNWIRLVSEAANGAIAKGDLLYQNRSVPKLLDVVRVPFLMAAPMGHQTENWIVDTKYLWTKTGHVPWRNLDKLTDPIADLWTVGHGTALKRNDMVGIAHASTFDHSLRFVKLSGVRISVEDAFRTPVRAHFTYNGSPYGLKVTDPNTRRKYREMGYGCHEVGDCYATISLAKPFKRNCYKLAAAIIEPSA